MVPGFLKLRDTVPYLAIIALLAMFLKLPEAPNFFGLYTCKSCSAGSFYMPLCGGAYFSLLLAASLLFPSFPSRRIARAGLLSALLVFISLTYLDLPNWCAPCLIGHLCNSAIWTIWVVAPLEVEKSTSPCKERLFLLLFAPVTIMALFSSLNLSFLVYSLKAKNNNVIATALVPGDLAPPFTTSTHQGNLLVYDSSHPQDLLLNFISPECTYCREQLQILRSLISSNSSFRLVNVAPSLPPDFVSQLPTAEWVEDKDGLLRQLFKVEGYPTLFVLSQDNRVLQVVSGLSDQLQTTLEGIFITNAP